MDVHEQVEAAGLRILRQSGPWLFHQCPNYDDHAPGQRAAKEADRAEQNARTAVGNLRRPPSPERRPPSRGERFNRLMEEARADAANEARRSVAS